MDEGFKFDVFLSYKSCDQDWVVELKNRLVSANLRVWLDRDEIRPGDRVPQALENGLATSRTTVIVCSKEAVGSRWVLDEYNRAVCLMNESDAQRRVIPVLLRDVELPGFLASRQWVDFRRKEDYEESLTRLLWGITGEWPNMPATAEEAAAPLHEIMLKAERSLTIWGHTLDKFAQDAHVLAALSRLLEKQVQVTLILLNPWSNYAKAHEPFHILESHGSARQQITHTINALRHVAEGFHHPTFNVLLTSYMPRFRTILVDDDTCYVSMYIFGEDVGRAPEFRLTNKGDGNASGWFESIASSVRRMVESAGVMSLVRNGVFNESWQNSRIASTLDNCLETRCCRPGGRCWNNIRRVILGYQNEDEHLALSLGICADDYRAGTFTVGEISSHTEFLAPPVRFEQWCNQVVRDDLRLVAQSHPLLVRSTSENEIARKVHAALVFDPPGQQRPLKQEIWYQEYSDVLRRLVTTFLVGDPDRELDLYPNLTRERKGFVVKVVKWLDTVHNPSLVDWLHLSVAAGLLGVDEKPSHAATSAIVMGSGIRLDQAGIEGDREVARVADELWQAAKAECRIDASKVFILMLQTSHGEFDLLSFPDDYLETIFLMKYYEKLLSDFPDVTIHFVPRSLRCSNDASYTDVHEFLELFPGLKDNSRFQVVPNGPNLGGVNLLKLHRDVLELVRECHALDIRGARNYEMLQGVNKEAYFGFMVCRDISESVTGLPSEKTPFVYLRQPPGARSFEGFEQRHMRIENGKMLAKVTVADHKAKWEGGYLASCDSWPKQKKEAYLALRDYYIDGAADFDARFGEQLEPEVKHFLDKFTGAVLAVGCGSGKEVEYLHTKRCQAYGIDYSAEAIRLANQRYPHLKDCFAVADLYDLGDFRTGTQYDGIVANAVLVHLLSREDIVDVLCSFRDRLRDGGLCYVRVLEKRELPSEMDNTNETQPRWFVYYTADEIAASAREAGFTLCEEPLRLPHGKGYRDVFWISALLKKPAEGSDA